MNTLKPLVPFLLQILAGIAVPLSMAPYDWHLLAYASIIIFLFGIEGQPVKRAGLLGFYYGLGLFGWGASWIFVSIYHFGNTTGVIAGVITALFVLILSLFPAATAALLNKIAPTPALSRWLLLFPPLWVGVEALRGWLLTGFPWLFLGYSQLPLSLSAFAPYGGVWAVSYATVLVGALLYTLFIQAKRHSHRIFLVIALLGLWSGSYWLKQQHTPLAIEPTVSVALIQGNIEQSTKWDPQRADAILAHYYQMTQAHYDADLIIWPETASPWPLHAAKPFLDQLDAQAKSQNTGIITGIPEQTSAGQFYNAIIGLGLSQGHYRKHHLVPFGEYVPLEHWLRGLIGFFDLPMSSFVSGPKQQPLIKTPHLTIAPTLCYEIAYPNLVRNNAVGSDILLTLSNDAWFGHSIGPHQHQQIAQFRALENGKYLIRSTNSGWTTLVGPDGDIIAEIPRFESGVLRGEVRAVPAPTFWLRHGAKPISCFLLIIGLLGLFHQGWRTYRRH